MPIWQYTPASLQQGHARQMPYFTQESPISPYPDSRTQSVMSSPVAVFTNNGQFTPIYDAPVQPPTRSAKSTPQTTHLRVPEFIETPEYEEAMEDDDSESYGWDSNQSPHTPPTGLKVQVPVHRRSRSANETSMKNAKRAHTVVERNYRERLNDKIADLALYLFETSSDCEYFFSPTFNREHELIQVTARTKPSKSLVMTRAKERLKQLESRNKSLEAEVVKLRQHIAILDHIATQQKTGESSPPPAGS